MMDFIEFDTELSDVDEEKEEISSMSTGGDDNSENAEEEEEDDELHTVDDDDDERRLEVLRLFLEQIQKEENLFDEDDCAAVKKEIKRMENSKRRLWKKQSNDRLKILSEYERVLKLSKFHPSLSDFFIKKHKKMERMIASLR